MNSLAFILIHVVIAETGQGMPCHPAILLNKFSWSSTGPGVRATACFEFGGGRPESPGQANWYKRSIL